MLHPVIQRPNDLRLALIQRPPLPVLKPLKMYEIGLGRWRINFSIIGESHQVQVWRDDHLQFAEMLVCMDFSPTQCDHYYRFDTLNTHQHRTPGYSVQVEFDSQARPKPRCDGSLRFDFPAAHGVLPITEIRWWQHEAHLFWWTLHVYPQAVAVVYVYSQSVLKID
jgi:hypothetical protein